MTLGLTIILDAIGCGLSTDNHHCARAGEIIGKAERKYSAGDEGDAGYFAREELDTTWAASFR